ncbi:alpha/beta fold hydrolase [Rhodococcus opacus]|uniref:alpha/beta fold hydrolase n=1 Tax=Rhodococcus opacus TaxID=37919 RepID=UPI000B2AE15B|nr:alpha/beta hydrolase [Rhodococcus opacus]
MNAGALIAGTAGAPTVMLIHGLASSYRVWDRVVPKIEQGADIVAAQLESEHSIERDADDAAALLRSPAVIVGHSRGGLVATALAERHPELVSALLLLCPPWSLASRLSARTPIERVLALPGVGELIWAMASPERQRAAQQSAFGPSVSVPDQFVDDLRARGRRNFVRSTQAIDTYLGARTLADRLTSLPVPTELVVGGLDARVASPAREFASVRHATVRVLPRVGHTPPWEAPDMVAEAIGRTLRSTTSATSSCNAASFGRDNTRLPGPQPLTRPYPTTNGMDHDDL